MKSENKSAKTKKIRLKTCANGECRQKFEVERSFQLACSIKCAIVIGKQNKAKKETKIDKIRKEKLKTLSDYKKEAQASVNKYINLRDKDHECISCGKSPCRGVRNASHYRSRGSNSFLSFNLWNIHSSCYKCNVMLSGNIGEYRPRLIKKIGIEKVEWLENSPRSRSYTKEYLVRLKTIFNKKCRRISK